MKMILETHDHSQRFEVDQSSVYVGSSEWKSDVCLEGPGIEEVHCELTRDEDSIHVLSLADSGVTINGQAVREATLRDGDELGIASLRFRLRSGAGQGEPGRLPQSSSAVSPLAPEFSRWIIRMGGLNLGPLDWSELQAMIGRGEVRLDDEAQRENETTWQPVRAILPQAGDDTWLCDDALLDSDSANAHQEQRPRSRRKPKRELSSAVSPGKMISAEDEEAFETNSVNKRKLVPAGAEDEFETPLAPQFFIKRGNDELGPLPREALQELADEGGLDCDTPVRLEEETRWTTAEAVGIHCRPAEIERTSDPRESATESEGAFGGFAWALVAPFFLLTGLVRSILEIDRRRLAIWSAGIAVVAFAAVGWIQFWLQTAATGTVTLDGRPVPESLITLTGAATGDSGMGVTDGNGNFTIVTLDGELKPGNYLVTVRPLSDVDAERPRSSDADEVPERYRNLNTTDVVVEVAKGQTEFLLELSSKPSVKSVRDGQAGFGIGASASEGYVE